MDLHSSSRSIVPRKLSHFCEFIFRKIWFDKSKPGSSKWKKKIEIIIQLFTVFFVEMWPPGFFYYFILYTFFVCFIRKKKNFIILIKRSLKRSILKLPLPPISWKFIPYSISTNSHIAGSTLSFRNHLTFYLSQQQWRRIKKQKKNLNCSVVLFKFFRYHTPKLGHFFFLSSFLRLGQSKFSTFFSIFAYS